MYYKNLNVNWMKNSGQLPGTQLYYYRFGISWCYLQCKEIIIKMILSFQLHSEKSKGYNTMPWIRMCLHLKGGKPQTYVRTQIPAKVVENPDKAVRRKLHYAHRKITSLQVY